MQMFLTPCTNEFFKFFQLDLIWMSDATVAFLMSPVVHMDLSWNKSLISKVVQSAAATTKWLASKQQQTALGWIRRAYHPYVPVPYIHRFTFRKRRHTHTHWKALFPGLPEWAGTRKAKPIWILLKQETVSGSGISWAICKSAPRFRQITTPAPHHSVFLQTGCPSCRPTNSIKALKAIKKTKTKTFWTNANSGINSMYHSYIQQ